MRKVETNMDDHLRPEYDLGSLQVRRVGPKRKTFRGQPIQLDPGGAAMLDSEQTKRETVYMENEVLTLKGHGIDLDMLAEDYDILVLPENAETHGELFDAGDAVSLAKHLKQSGAKCGNTPDIGVDCPTLDRKSDDLWLGLVWILGNAAWPFLINVVANMFTDPLKSPFTKGKIHAKLRWRQNGELERLDWQGDGATLIEVLKTLRESSEKDAA